jgi:hypothetical protein
VKNRLRRKSIQCLLGLSIALILGAGVHLGSVRAEDNPPVDPDANYDRLDGSGQSGKTVQVIEWEGNLEIHVYPKGSLKGLALKIDKTKDKKVMVIGYRFADNPREQLIRRAILGIDLQDGFKAFKDPTEGEFDKVIISNNGLSGQVVGFALDPTPKQLYPDGHPALAQAQQRSQPQPRTQGRMPASVQNAAQNQTPSAVPAATTDEDGGIKPFFK